jgi:hypothetical protein
MCVHRQLLLVTNNYDNSYYAVMFLILSATLLCSRHLVCVIVSEKETLVRQHKAWKNLTSNAFPSRNSPALLASFQLLYLYVLRNVKKVMLEDFLLECKAVPLYTPWRRLGGEEV